MYEEIIQRIKELRVRSGMKQADLAFEINESTSAVSHIENQRREVKLRTLIDMNEAFKDTLGDQWLYICTGEKAIPIDNGTDYVDKMQAVDAFIEFMAEAEAFKTIRIKGTVESLAAEFAKRLFITTGTAKVSNGG